MLKKLLFIALICTSMESMHAAGAPGLRNHIRRRPSTQKATSEQVSKVLRNAIRDNDSFTFKNVLTNVDLPSLSSQSTLGDTPLHLAVKCERKNFIEALLKAGAPLDIKNNEGKTPAELDINKQFDDLFLAAAQEQPDVSSKPATPIIKELTNPFADSIDQPEASAHIIVSTHPALTDPAIASIDTEDIAEQERLNAETSTEILPHAAEQQEELNQLAETNPAPAQERYEAALAEAHESLERIRGGLDSITELQADISADHARRCTIHEAKQAKRRAKLDQAEAQKATAHEELLRLQEALVQKEEEIEASERQYQVDQAASEARVNEARENYARSNAAVEASIRSLKRLASNILLFGGGGTIVAILGTEWRKACKKVNAHILEQQKIALAKKIDFNEPTKMEYTKAVLRLMHININAEKNKAKKTALGLALVSLASGIGIRAWAY